MGVKNGAVDSKVINCTLQIFQKIKEFRQSNDARIESKIVDRKSHNAPIDQMIFGKPNRPSTPINGVISNYYGETAVQEIQDKYSFNAELV